MPIKTIILNPIKESSEDFEAIEEAIKELFKREIYFPILGELSMKKKALHNAMPGLLDGIRSGRITFYRGTFSGRFNSAISKDLQKMGARFDRKTGTYKIEQSSLPQDVRNAISVSLNKFQEKIAGIDKKLAQILPEEIAGKLKIDHLFDRTLWKKERSFRDAVKGITIAPKLTPEQAKRISAEWSENMQLWIKDFTEKEIKELRQNIEKTVFTGNRYGSAIKTIQDSYGVSARKAKFLARQETSLLATKFEQVRYQAAGSEYYKWGCVSGTKLHPVRPMHKALEGKIFRWDTGAIVNVQGEKKNPGQDYNCRCFARPILNFKEK